MGRHPAEILEDAKIMLEFAFTLCKARNKKCKKKLFELPLTVLCQELITAHK